MNQCFPGSTVRKMILGGAATACSAGGGEMMDGKGEEST